MDHTPRPTFLSAKSSYITTTHRPVSTITPRHPDGRPLLAHEVPLTINIGTRKSHLALVQTDLVIAELRKSWPQHTYVVHAISTMGDKNQGTALGDFNAKALWTEELEAMLEEGAVDAIVHCCKDIPTQISPSFTLGAILNREDPRDVLVLSPRLPRTATLSSLPPGSIMGCAIRRAAQLSRLHPHLKFQSVRGNINTRLAKLDAEDSVFSGIILAAAGLLRIGEGRRISRYLSSHDIDGNGVAGRDGQGEDGNGSGDGQGQGQDPLEAQAESQSEAPQPSSSQTSSQPPPPPTSSSTSAPAPPQDPKKWGVLHAVGQGALAIEMRTDDTRTFSIFSPLNHTPTALACLAERSLMRTLEGGCSVPIGVETEWSDASEASSAAQTEGVAENGGSVSSKSKNHLTMRATVVSLDGTLAACATHTSSVTTAEDSDDFGRETARLLIEDGAESILKDIHLDRGILEGQAGNA